MKLIIFLQKIAKISLILFSLSILLPDENSFKFKDDIDKHKFQQLKLSVSEAEYTIGEIQGGGAEFSSIDIYKRLNKSLNEIKNLKKNQIETQFKFSYKYEITQGGVVLDDIRFLRIIGEFDKADSLLDIYKKKLIKYYESKAFFYSDSGQTIREIEKNKYENNIKTNEMKMLKNLILASFAYLSINNYNIQQCINDNDCSFLTNDFDGIKEKTYEKNDLILKSSFLLVYSYIIYDFFDKKFINKRNFEKSYFFEFNNNQPIIEQKLNFDEIKILIDEYNNALYELIRSDK